MDSVISKIDEFWSWIEVPVRDWLNALDWSQIWLSIVIVIVVLGLRNILARVVVRLTVAVGGAIGIKIGDAVQTAITPAARALIVSLACLISLRIISPPDVIAATIERVLISVAIAAVFTAAYSFTDLLAPYRSTQTQIQVDWLVRLAKIVVVILAIAAVFKVWGIDLGPVITGMGVFGAGVALAAQDLFKNLIAGMTNISEKRFQVGDWIKVEGVIEGVVERVEFRSTTVRRFDRAPAHVPNGDLANASLINFSRMPHRRIYWMINLVYSTTTEQLAEISKSIKEYIDACGDFVPEGQAARFVHVDSFAGSSIDILVYCFTRSPAYADYLAAKEKLVLSIKDAVESAGTSFAFPSRSIYLEAAPDAGPERFVPRNIREGAGETKIE